MRKFLAGLVLAAISLVAPVSAQAACGGSSPSLAAASPAYSDVNDCVAVAVAGDTINIPAGTATWTSTLTLPTNRHIWLKGSTIGTTKLINSVPGGGADMIAVPEATT